MSSRVKLEVDPSILEKKLDFRVRLNEEQTSVDNAFSELFPTKAKEPEVPFKFVQPEPGFIVKLRTMENDKIFLNICHCEEVPEPKDLDEQKLANMQLEAAANEDVECWLTIPMSIGDLHTESDKSGNLASVYDIAINTTFFNRLKESAVLKDNFIPVILQGVGEKHKLQLDMETNAIILKHRKCIGTIQTQRIAQRPIKEPPKKLIELLPENEFPCTATTAAEKRQRPLIKELSSSSQSNKLLNPSSKKIQIINNGQNQNSDNNLENVKLIKKNGPVKKIIAIISISALTGKEIELDVGEDRILVYSPKKNEVIDFFLPYNIDRDNVTAEYLVNTQTLKVEMPMRV